MSRVTIMAGGTGGHIFPGLAVADALKKRGVTVDWLGASGGMELSLVAKQGIPVTAIDIRALRGKGLLTALGMPWRLGKAVWQAAKALRNPPPGSGHVVLSLGGYVAAPGGVAARLLNRPLVVHEQNSVLGLTNRTLARWANQVLTGFDLADIPGTRCVGNPVRQSIIAVGVERARHGYGPIPGAIGHGGDSTQTHSAQRRIRLLALGGSQGAQSLNTRLPRQLARWVETGAIEIWHQSGKNKQAATERAYAQAGLESHSNIKVEPFIEDMASAYRWADMVVARAGALSLAEIQAAALPAVLVPFPQAVDDHQRHNAEHAVSRQAALMWLENQPESLLHAALARLIESPDKRRAMAERSHALSVPDAADKVAQACLEVMAA